jgi:hypothetical protein
MVAARAAHAHADLVRLFDRDTIGDAVVLDPRGQTKWLDCHGGRGTLTEGASTCSWA